MYSGNANFAGSTSPSLSQNVNPASTSTTAVTDVNPSVTGQVVTITATTTVMAPGAGTPSGTVDFQDGGLDITGCAAQPVSGLGGATCVTTFASAGTHSITAIYSGDANFTGSTSPSVSQTVNQASTAVLVDLSANPSVAGQSVTYTAVVSVTAPGSGTPTGTVSFADGAVAISGCVAQPLLGGVASCTVAYPTVGAHPITATYGGDADFTGSVSPSILQTVDQASTASAAGSWVNPSVTGQAVTITATVTVDAPGAGTPTGTIEFDNGGSAIAGCDAQAVSGSGTATCATSFPDAGTYPITVIYSGDANFSTSTSSVLMQTVDQGATAAVIASSVNPSVPGEGLTYTATVTAVAPANGTPTGTVTFLDGATVVSGCAAQPIAGGVASCSVTFPDAGTYAMSAVYSGDADFDGSTSPTLTQTVAQGSTTTTMTSSSNGTIVEGYAVTFTATIAPLSPASGVPTGTVEFMDGAVPISGCTAQAVVAGVAQCSVTYADAGVHAMSAVYSGDHDFAGSTAPSVTMTVSADPSVPDTGTHVAPSVWGGIAVLAGFLLLFLGMLGLRRSRSGA